MSSLHTIMSDSIVKEAIRLRVLSQLKSEGVKAVLTALRNAGNNRQPGASHALTTANLRWAGILTVILDNWPEDEA